MPRLSVDHMLPTIKFATDKKHVKRHRVLADNSVYPFSNLLKKLTGFEGGGKAHLSIAPSFHSWFCQGVDLP